MITLENKPHVVELLSGLCEVQELDDTKTMHYLNPLTQASLSLLGAGLSQRPEVPRQGMPWSRWK